MTKNCLECHHLVDNATCFTNDGGKFPDPGDITICLYCGHIMAFSERGEGHLRPLNGQEMRDVAGDPHLLALMELRLEALKMKG